VHHPHSQAVCRNTLKLGSSQGPSGKSQLPELQLIASRAAIMQPPELEGIQAIALRSAAAASPGAATGTGAATDASNTTAEQ